MGMQSTGKSFWLNHFAGTLFNVSGGRCTDGVWLSAVVVEVEGRKCLLLALDFEGLGSFERSAQEDMLLSIFNAAISGLTVYRTGQFFGRDTAATFQKFETGVGCIKGSDKLFQGTFMISVKDVMRQSMSEVKKEFGQKIRDRVMRSNGQPNPNNFLSSMYKGGVGIAPFPSPTENAYFAELVKSQAPLFGKPAQFPSGAAFAGVSKHLMAKLVLKDWTSFGGQEGTMRVGYLIRHLPDAISVGALNVEVDASADNNLVDSAKQPMADATVIYGAPCDAQLLLCVIQPPVMELMVPFEGIKEQLLRAFASAHARSSLSPQEYKDTLQQWLDDIVSRRCQRVTSWMMSWLTDADGDALPEEGEVRNPLCNVRLNLQDLRNKWKLCGAQCTHCFHLCLLERDHPGGHDCSAAHDCDAVCAFCSEDLAALDPGNPDLTMVPPCSLKAGHDGQHHCSLKDHLCGEPCHLSHLRNCMETCGQPPGHEGVHECVSKRHLCEQQCALPSCANFCQSAHDVHHEVHRCQEMMCPFDCLITSCTRKCDCNDHFHDMAPDAVHLCANEHPCDELCEEEGICKIDSQLTRVKRTFAGKHGDFEYEHQVEQNGHREKCCVVIPAGETSHLGRHAHTEKEDAVHYCEEQCVTCDYYCNKVGRCRFNIIKTRVESAYGFSAWSYHMMHWSRT